jgi:hypothetical protein
VFKTRTFRLQPGTKPVQCSFIATPDCRTAWVGLREGRAPCRRLICVSSIGI